MNELKNKYNELRFKSKQDRYSMSLTEETRLIELDKIFHKESELPDNLKTISNEERLNNLIELMSNLKDSLGK